MSRKVRAVVLLQPWNAFIKHLRDAGSLINLLLDETFRDLESEGEKLVAAMRILDGKLGLRVDLTDHSESRSTVQLRAQDLKRVPFQEDTFFAVKDESGEIWVQAKPVAETLGLRWHGQFEHIQRDEALRDTIRVIRMVSPHPNNPQKAITREALFVTLNGLTLWLAKLQPSRIKNEAKRARVVRYQKEAGRALRNYFFRGAAVNPRAAVDTAALATAVREAVARALEKAGEETAVEIEQLRVQRLHLLRCFFEQAKQIPGVSGRYLKRLNELTVSEALGLPERETQIVELTAFLTEQLGRKPEAKELLSFSKLVARRYKEAHGRDPDKRIISVSGKEVLVNCYTRDELPFLERCFSIWRSWLEKAG